MVMARGTAAAIVSCCNEALTDATLQSGSWRSLRVSQPPSIAASRVWPYDRRQEPTIVTVRIGSAETPRCVVGDRGLGQNATTPRRSAVARGLYGASPMKRLAVGFRIMTSAIVPISPQAQTALDVRTRRTVQPGEPLGDGVCRLRRRRLCGHARRADRDGDVHRARYCCDALPLRTPSSSTSSSSTA